MRVRVRDRFRVRMVLGRVWGVQDDARVICGRHEGNMRAIWGLYEGDMRVVQRRYEGDSRVV